MLKGMEGSTLGVWVSHGEGRVKFPDTAIYNRVTEEKLAPLRYVDDANEATEVYPFNPNGSVDGIAALCSPDGRHLAIVAGLGALLLSSETVRQGLSTLWAGDHAECENERRIRKLRSHWGCGT